MNDENSIDQYCASIIPGNVKINKILETETVLAYYAREPLWPIHIIVIPKHHITSILDFAEVNSQIIVDLMKTISQVAKEVTKEHGQCRIMTNAGEYQHTKHLHWHIFSEK
ncbi:MAG: HIT domain-containing protein [Candidatus Levyibacteriota bacterium]